MKYKALHRERDKYYSIGIDEETGKYVMAVVVPWVAWYSRYYKI